jgi:DNA-binding winged helix-turn-helix (wHTH) protein/predicted ATPase
MQAEQQLRFGPYRFAPGSGQLWRGAQEVKLTPKALALLRVLVTRAGHVVTKDELFQSVWLDTVVSDDALTSCMQDLRQALRDSARKPRYIETVHRRGFRFIAHLRSDSPSVSGSWVLISGQDTEVQEARDPKRETFLVGREAALAQLHGWLEKALAGERQVVFVTGEPGIGKTTLIEAFLHGFVSEGRAKQKAKIEADPRPLPPSPWIARGQCIEHYGAGEAYLPILESLGRLCRETDGQRLRALLHQQAPMWLVQMPALLDAAELDALQRRTAGATRERMLRELAEALEVVTREHPLVLVLEDSHWSDVSTLDLLSMLARRQEAARLLIMGTYRPVDVMVHGHPLRAVKQELQLHGHCQELALDFLSEAAVGKYLEQRFDVGATGRSPLQRLAHVVHQRTDGNPLFMVSVVEHLLSRAVLTQVEERWTLKNEELTATVPENLRQLITQQLERLRPEVQRVLEVASVAGAEFSAATVAAGMEQSVEAIETHCDALVRREQFLQSRGASEWPDGTIAARYGFVHALYQEVVYEQPSATRRSRLHRQIGERQEQAYGKRVREIAAELAIHFERGRDYRRAVQYLQQAGENAVRRSAHQEAITLLTKGLELLNTLPDTPERARQELTLQIMLGSPLQATKGNAAPELEKACTRALELCRQVGETPQLLLVLGRLLGFYLGREELQTARELGKQCLSLAQSMRNPAHLLGPHHALGHTLFSLGELALAQEHLEQGIILYNLREHGSYTSRGEVDLRVGCLSYAALTLWFLGYPTQALKRSHEALTVAEKLDHPYSLAFALDLAAMFCQLRRESQTARKQAESAITLCVEQGFPYYLAWGTSLRGCALVEQGQVEEGIAGIRQGLAAWRTTGAERHRPYFLTLLAEAYGKAGQAEEGLTILVEALAALNKTGGRVWEAELYRLKGELTLQQFQVLSSKFQVQENQKSKIKRQK